MIGDYPNPNRMPAGGAPGVRQREARHLPWRGLLAFLVLLVPLATPRDLGAAQQGAPPHLFGIAGHAWWLDPQFEQFYSVYRDLGVTGVRLPVVWKVYQP